MKAAPAIALVVPAYNAAHHLPNLFATVRAQREPFDEIIVCDDASTDDTVAVAQGLGARVVRREKNGGCSAAKNSGLAEVRSPWVHFNDADDLIERDFVSTAHALLAEDDCDVLMEAWEYRDAATRELLSASDVDAASLNADAVAANLADTIPNVGIYRTAMIREQGGFNCAPDVLFNEDRAFHLKLALAGARFRVSRVHGLTMLRFGDSMSQKNQVRCLLANAAITLNYLKQHGTRHADACGKALWRAATGLATHGEMRQALKLIEVANDIGARVEPNASAHFAALCRVNPKLALWLREYGVRIFKPGLRAAGRAA